jgi:hypothetical protein
MSFLILQLQDPNKTPEKGVDDKGFPTVTIGDDDVSQQQEIDAKKWALGPEGKVPEPKAPAVDEVAPPTLPEGQQQLTPISLESLVLMGTTYEEALKSGYKAVPMTYDESLKTNAKIIKESGISEEQFAEIFNSNREKETSHAKKYNIGTFDSKAKPLDVAKYSNYQSPKTVAALDIVSRWGTSGDFKQFVGHDTYKAQVTASVYDDYGNSFRTETKEQEAERHAVYKNNFGKFERLDRFQSMDYLGRRFKENEDGSKSMLVLENKGGLSYWKEVDAEQSQKASIARSIHGPKEERSSGWRSALDSGFNSTIDATAGSLGTMAEIVGYASDWMSGNQSPGELTKWGRKTQNWANISHSKIAEWNEKQGVFDSWTGVGNVFGAAVPQIVGAIFMSRLGGIYNAAKAAGASQKTQETLSMIGTGASYMFGAGYSAHAMNQAGIENELSEGDRLLLATAMGGVTMVSERILDKMGATGSINRALGRQNSAEKTKAAMKEHIDKYVGQYAPKLKAATTPAEKQAVANTIAKKASNGIYKALGGVATVAAIGKNAIKKGLSMGGSGKLLRNMAAGALEEAGEEGFEALGENALQFFHDYVLAEDGSIKGQGAFGAELITPKELLENMVGGMIGGSFGGVIRTLSNYDEDTEISNATFAEMATRYTEEEAEKIVRQYHKEAALGNPFLSETDQLLVALPNETAGKIESKNDIALQTTLQQLKLAYQTKRSLGLNNPKLIADVMGGDKALAKDALKLAMDEKFYGRAHAKLKEDQAKLDDKEGKTLEYQNLQKKIEEYETIMGVKQKGYAQIMDGSLYGGYQAVMLSNTLIFNKQHEEQKKNISKSNKSAKEKQLEITNATNNAIEIAKKDDNFNNMHRANQANKMLKKIGAENKVAAEEIAKERAGDAYEDDLDTDNSLKSIWDNVFIGAGTQKGIDLTETVTNLINAKANSKNKDESGAGVFTPAQVDKANKILLAAEESARLSLKTINKAFEKHKAPEGETKPQFGETDQDSMATYLKDESPYTADEARGLQKVAEDAKSTTFTTRESKVKDVIYADNSKTVKDIKGNSFRTNLLEEVKEEDLGKDYYYKKNKETGEVEEVDKDEYDQETGDFPMDDDHEYFKEDSEDELEHFVRYITGYKKDGTPIKKIEGVKGRKISAEQHALSEIIRMSKSGETFDRALAQIESNLRMGTQLPSKGVLSSILKIKEEIQERMDAIQLLMSLKGLDMQGYEIPPYAKKFIGWDEIKDISLADMMMNYHLLENAYVYSEALYSTVNNLIDDRASTFEQFKIEKTKISAEMHNILSNHLDGEASYFNDKNERIVLERPDVLDPDSDDLTELETQLAKQYWHVYFNTTDADGNYVNVIDKDDTDFLVNSLYDPQTGFIAQEMVSAGGVQGETTNRKKDNAMFATDLVDFTLEKFRKPFETKSTNSASRGVYFREAMIFHYVTSAMAIDPKEHKRAFLSILDEPTNKSKTTDDTFKIKAERKYDDEKVYVGAHNEEQLQAIDFLNGFIYARARMKNHQTDPKAKKFKEAFDMLRREMYYGGFDVYQTGYENQIHNDHIMVLHGNAGVGKTTYTTLSIIEMAKKSLGDQDVVLVAPTEDQLVSLEKAAKIAGVEYESMTFDKFKKEYKKYNNKLIIMDEYSLNKPVELADMIAENGDTMIDSSNTVIVMGDEMQSPPNVAEGALSINSYVLHLPNMVSVMRSGYVDVSNIQDFFRILLRGSIGSTPSLNQETNYYMGDDGWAGAKRYNSFEDMNKDALKRVNKSEEGKAVLIVFDEIEKDSAQAAGYNPNRIKTIAQLDNSPQGKEYDEVFVFIPQGEDEGPMKRYGSAENSNFGRDALNRYMLTAVSRAKNFLGIVMDGKDSNNPVNSKDHLDQSKVDKKTLIKGKVKLWKETNDLLEGLSKINIHGTLVKKNSSTPTNSIVPPAIPNNKPSSGKKKTKQYSKGKQTTDVSNEPDSDYDKELDKLNKEYKKAISSQDVPAQVKILNKITELKVEEELKSPPMEDEISDTNIRTIGGEEALAPIDITVSAVVVDEINKSKFSTSADAALFSNDYNVANVGNFYDYVNMLASKDKENLMKLVGEIYPNSFEYDLIINALKKDYLDVENSLQYANDVQDQQNIALELGNIKNTLESVIAKQHKGIIAGNKPTTPKKINTVTLKGKSYKQKFDEGGLPTGPYYQIKKNGDLWAIPVRNTDLQEALKAQSEIKVPPSGPELTTAGSSVVNNGFIAEPEKERDTSIKSHIVDNLYISEGKNYEFEDGTVVTVNKIFTNKKGNKKISYTPIGGKPKEEKIKSFSNRIKKEDNTKKEQDEKEKKSIMGKKFEEDNRMTMNGHISAVVSGDTNEERANNYFKNIKKVNEIIGQLAKYGNDTDIEVVAISNKKLTRFNGEVSTSNVIVFRVSEDNYNILLGQPAGTKVTEDERTIGIYDITGKQADVAYKEQMTNLYKSVMDSKNTLGKTEKHVFSKDEVGIVDAESIEVQPAYSQRTLGEALTLGELVNISNKIGVPYKKNNDNKILIVQVNGTRAKMKISLARDTESKDKKLDLPLESPQLKNIKDSDVVTDYLGKISNSISQKQASQGDSITGSELQDIKVFFQYNMNQLSWDYRKKMSYVDKLIDLGLLKVVDKSKDRKNRKLELVVEEIQGVAGEVKKIRWESSNTKTGLKDKMLEGIKIIYKSFEGIEKGKSNIRIATVIKTNQENKGIESKNEVIPDEYLSLFLIKDGSNKIGTVHSGTISVQLGDEVKETIKKGSLTEDKDYATDDTDPDFDDDIDDDINLNELFSRDTKDVIRDLAEYENYEDEVNQAALDFLGESYVQKHNGIDYHTNRVIGRNRDRLHGSISNRGKIALNRMSNGKISMTAFLHEMVHYIDFFLLKPDIKNAIYKEIESKTGLTGLAASEYLADSASEWMAKRKRLTGWSKLFQGYLDWFTNVVNNVKGLLGFHNEMKRFYYDVYYKKKYKNQPAWRTVAPEFELLASRDYRNPFGPVRKMFPSGRPAMASFATQAVVYEMATKLLGANFNNTSVGGNYSKDGYFNFDKVITDLEYKWREIALQELIRSNPTVEISTARVKQLQKEKGEDGSFSGKELEPMPYFQVVMKDGSTTINSSTKIKDIKSLMYLNKNYEYADAHPDKNGRWFNKDKNIRAIFRPVIRRKLIENNVSIGKYSYGDHNTIDEAKSPLSENVVNLNNSDKIKHIAFATLDDHVLFGMIQQYFPGLPLGDPKTKSGGGVFYSHDRQQEDFKNYLQQVQRIQDSVSKQENAETSPMENQSDLLRIALNTLPLVEVVAKENKKGVVTIHETKQHASFVDVNEMEYLMQELGSEIYYKYEDEINSSEIDILASRVNDMLAAYRKSKSKKETNMVGDTTVEHLLSLNDRYFDQSKLSHYTIIKLWEQVGSAFYDEKYVSKSEEATRRKDPNYVDSSAERIRKNARDRKKKAYEKYKKKAIKSGQKAVGEEVFFANIESLARVSTKLLNGIISHYKNIGPQQYKRVIKRGKYTRVKHTEARGMDEQIFRIKSALKDNLLDDAGLPRLGAINMFAKGFIASTDDKATKGKSAALLFKEDGLYYHDSRNKKDIKIVDLKNPNEDTLKDVKNLDKREMVRKILKVFGLNPSSGVAAKLSSGRLVDKDTGFQDFKEMVINWGLSSYIYVNSNTEAGKSGNNQKKLEIYKDFLANKTKNKVYGQLSESEIKEIGRDEKAEGPTEEGKVFFPSAFNTQVNDLSNLMIRTTGGRYSKFFYNIDGRKIQLSTTTSSLEKHFRNGNSKAFAQKFKAENAKGILNSEGELSENLETHNIMGGVILNPLNNDHDKPFLVSLDTIEGFALKTGGKTIEKMSERDNFDLVHSMFIDNLIGNFSKPSAIPLTSMSDRKTQKVGDFNFRLGGKKETNGLLIREAIEGTKKYNYKLDSATIMQHIEKILLIQEKAQLRSVNRWINFFREFNIDNNTSFPVMDYVKEANPNDPEDLIRQRDEVEQKLEEIKNTLRTNKFKEENFMRYNMRASHDYTIHTGVYRGNPIHIGYDTMMNGDIEIEAGRFKKKGASSTINGNVFNRRFTLDTDGTYKLDYKGKTRFADLLAKHRMDPDGVKLDDDIKRKFIFQIFKKSLSFNNKIAKQNGYKMPARFYGPKAEDSDVNEGLKDSEGKYNDIWVALIIGHQIANDYVMYATNGTLATETDTYVSTSKKVVNVIEGLKQEQNIKNYDPVKYSSNNNKRLSVISSPMFVPTFGGFNDLDKKSQYIKLQDPKIGVDVLSSYKRAFNSKVESFDGMGFRNPMVAELMFRSMGEEFGMMNRRGMLKSTNNQMNHSTGMVDKFKWAVDNITAGTLKKMPMQNDMLKMMLNPTNRAGGSLYHLLQEHLTPTEEGDVKTFDEAIKLVTNEYVAARYREKIYPDNKNPYEYISGMYFGSGIKQQGRKQDIPFSAPFGAHSKSSAPGSGNIKVPEFNDAGQLVNVESFDSILDAYKARIGNDIYKFTEEYDHTQEGIQLNANKRIGDMQETPMTQLMSIILASPTQNTATKGSVTETQRGVALLAELAAEGLSEFMSLLDKDRSLADKLIKYSPDQFSGLKEMGFEELDITDGENDETKSLQRKVMELCEKALDRAEDGSVLSRLVSEKIGDSFANTPDFGGVRTRAYQYLAAYMRSRVIKNKMSAMRLVQGSAGLIEMVEYVNANGEVEVFNIEDAKKFAERKGIAYEYTHPVEIDGEFIEDPDAEGVELVANSKKEADEIIKNHFKYMDSLGKKSSGIFIRKPLNNFEIDMDEMSLSEDQKSEIDTLDKQAKLEIKALRDNNKFKAAEERRLEWIGNRYAKFHEWGKKVVKRGQVVLPSSRLEQYGIPKDTALSSIFRVWEKGGIDEPDKDNNLRKLASNAQATSEFTDSEGNPVMLSGRELIKNKLSELINNNLGIEQEGKGENATYKVVYNDDATITKGDNPVWDIMVAKLQFEATVTMKKAKRKHIIDRKKGKAVFKSLEELVQSVLETLADKPLNEMADALISIANSLDTLSVRTPSGPGSGYIAQIVGFINDNGSTGYFNPAKNVIDGSDYDIDQITAYFLANTFKELGYSQKEIDAMDESRKKNERLNGISNKILEFLNDYYTNPDNDIFTKSSVDKSMEKLKGVAKDAINKIFHGYENGNDLALSIMYRVSTFDGKVVGPFALAQKAQTFLYTAHEANGGGILNENIQLDGENSLTYLNKLSSYVNLPINMETLVNGATDNPKLQLLGLLGVSFNNANLVSSMFLLQDDVMDYMRSKGRTSDDITDEYDAIFDLLMSEAHLDVADKMKKDRDVSEKDLRGQSLFATAHKMLDEIQSREKGRTKTKEKLIKDNKGYRARLRELLIKNVGFSKKDVDLILAVKDDGDFLKMDWSKQKGLKKEIYSVLDITDNLVKISDKENKDLSADESEEIVYLTKTEEAKVELVKTIANLRYRLGNNERRINRLNKFLSKEYKNDLFMISKYGMMSDYMSGITGLVNINQGTAISSYDMDKYQKNVEFMTGMKFGQLLKMYDEFKGSNLTAVEFVNKNTKIENIKKVAFDQYKHRLAGDNHDWMKYNLTSNIKVMDNDTGDYKDSVQTINYQEQFHQLGNATAALFSRPDIMEYIKAAAVQDYTDKKIFAVSLPAIEFSRNEFLDSAGKDYFNERQWNTFNEQLDEFYVSKFFNTLNTKSDFNTVIDNLKESLNIDSFTSNELGDFKVGASIEDPIARRSFVMQFGNFFLDSVADKLKEKGVLKDKASVKLIEQLEIKSVNGIDYLMFKNMGYQYTDADIQEFQQGFSNLPEPVRKIITYYQIAKDGFQYKAGTFAKVIDTTFHKDFSSYINKIKTGRDLGTLETKGKLKGHSKEFVDSLETFYETLSGKPNLGLLNFATRVKDEAGKTQYLPPKAAYGLAKKYYHTVNTVWTPFGVNQLLAYAKLKSQDGFAYSRHAGNAINLTAGAKKEGLALALSPYNLMIDGISIAARTFLVGDNKLKVGDKEVIIKGANLLYKELETRVDFEMKKLRIKEGDEASRNEIREDKITELYSKETLNRLAEERRFHKDYFYGTGFRNKYEKTDEKTESTITDYTLMRNDLIKVMRTLYLEAFTKDTGLIMDVLKDSSNSSVFTDNNIRTIVNPAYVLSQIMNEFITVNGKDGKISEKRVLEVLKEMKDNPMQADMIMPAYEYDYLRHQWGGIANSYDPVNHSLVNMNLDAVNKKIIPYLNQLVGYKKPEVDVTKKEDDDTLSLNIKKDADIPSPFTEYNVRKTLIEYAMAVDRNNGRPLGVADMKTVILNLDNKELTGSINENNIDELNELLSNSPAWVEYNVTQSKMNENLQKIKSIEKSIKKEDDVLIDPVKISRLTSHIMQVGEYIHLSDGTTGIITKLSDSYQTYKKGAPDKTFYRGYVYQPLVHKSKNKKLIQESRFVGPRWAQRANNKNSLKKFVEVISNSMPHIKFHFITDEQSRKMGIKDANSFVMDGQVYINVDRADKGIGLHEFTHPLTLALERDNPELFSIMVDALKDTPLYYEVKSKYPELRNERDLMHEVIPTFLQRKYYDNESSKGLVRRFTDWLKNFLKKMIGLRDGSAIDKLDLEVADMQDISNAIISDFMAGRVISNITSAEVSDLLPHVQKSKPEYSPNDIRVLNSFNIIGEDTNEQESLKNYLSKSIHDKIITSGSVNATYIGPSGKVYDLSEGWKKGTKIKQFYTNNKFDPSKRDARVENIAKNEAKGLNKLSGNITKFLNKATESDKIFQAAYQTFRKGWDPSKGGRIRRKDEDYEIEKAAKEVELNIMMTHMGFNPEFDVAIDTSLKGYAKELKKYDMSMSEDLVGGAPIIIVHNAKNNEADQKQVSIYYTSGGRINKPLHAKIRNDGSTLTKTVLQGDSYLEKGKRHQIYLKNTVHDLNIAQAAIQAMALKESNPEIHINHIGTIGIYADFDSGSETNGFKVYNSNLRDVLPQLQLLYKNNKKAEEVPARIRTLLSNDKINNKKAHKSNLTSMIRQYAKTLLAKAKSDSNFKGNKKAIPIYESILKATDDFEDTNRIMSGYKLAKLLHARITWMRKNLYKANPDDALVDDEYLQLIEMYQRLMTTEKIADADIQELGWFEKWGQLADRFDDDIRNWVFDEINIGLNRAKEIESEFGIKNNEFVIRLQKESNSLSRISDKSRDLFEPMFKKKDVNVMDGNGKILDKTQSVSIMEIHWNEKDPETKAAIDARELTPTMLEYGKFLVDQLEKEFTTYLMEKNFLTYTNTEELRKADMKTKRAVAWKLAQKEVANRWKKGMLPAMPRQYTAALTEGDRMDALKLFMSNASRAEGAFEEYFDGEGKPKVIRYKYVPANFWSQFTSSTNYGSVDRLAYMGLKLHNDEVVVADQENQRNLSYNLQNISNYAIASSARARSMDDAVDAANVAIDILKGMALKKGTRTTDHIKQLRVYTNRNIYGQLPKHGRVRVGKMAVMLDDIIHAANATTTNIAMALSPVLGLKNFAASKIKMWSNALANSWVKNEFFGAADVTKAVSEFLTNPQKISNLNTKYKIVAMSERDIINHAKNNRTRQHLMESDALMIQHFMGDYVNQLIAFTAQMIKDGTYDAHDNDGNYDYLYDERFFKQISIDTFGDIEEVYNTGNVGNMTEDGKMIMDNIRQNLIREKLHGQMYDPEGPLKAAYFGKQTNKIKVIIQRYVSEITDSQYKNQASAYGMVKLTMSLKSFLWNWHHEWFQRLHMEESIGKQKVIMEDGKKKVVWEPMLVEGVAFTLFSTMKKMYEFRGNPSKTWDDMSDWQKRNLAKLVAFSTITGGFLALYGMIDWGDDEDDKSETHKACDRIFLGAAEEQLTQLNGLQGFIEMKNNTIPAVHQFENFSDFFVLTAMLPWAINDAGVATAIDKWIYTATKTTPIGALPRDLRQIFGNYINDFLLNYDKKAIAAKKERKKKERKEKAKLKKDKENKS